MKPGKSGFVLLRPDTRRASARRRRPSRAARRIEAARGVFSEGPAGVANAVKNLWSNIGAYTSGAFRYVFAGGNLVTTGHTGGGEPITGRDVIALLATIGVDMGLLALAILNPPREPPSIRPSGSLARQIRDAIDTAINRAPGADLEWVRRHFVHHNKASYLVIPNLYSADPNEQRKVGERHGGEPACGRAERSRSGALAEGRQMVAVQRK